MAAPLGLEGVTVERIEGGPLEVIAGGPLIGIHVRNNLMRVTKRGAVLLEELTATSAVGRINARTFTVLAANGSKYLVTKVRDCGCGR